MEGSSKTGFGTQNYWMNTAEKSAALSDSLSNLQTTKAESLNKDHLDLSAQAKSTQEKALKQTIQGKASDMRKAALAQNVIQSWPGMMAEYGAEAWIMLEQPTESDVHKLMGIDEDGVMVHYYKEKGGRNITEIKTAEGVIRWIFVKRINYTAGKDLSRLARLSRSGDVKSLAAGVRANMNRIRGDRYLDKDEIKQALAQMEGVILRAKTKIKHLNDEDSLKVRGHRAVEIGEMERAEEMVKELKRRKMIRKAREYGQICGTVHSLNGLYNEQRHSPESRLEMEQSISGLTAPVDLAPPIAPEVAPVPIVADIGAVQAVDIMA